MKYANDCLYFTLQWNFVFKSVSAFVTRVSSLYLDQVNTGSVAGDLESGTPVPQEVPENVQVTIKKDFKITLEVSCIMILNFIFERDPI